MEQQAPKFNWQNYPRPRLVSRRGVYVVEVSIPVSIRYLFGNGSGTTSNRRKSTGTSDKIAASKKVIELTNIIYREFDQKQIDHKQKHDIATDAFAVGVITELAKEFNYNNGDMPELVSTTDYNSLLEMKNAFENYTDLMESKLPPREQVLNAAAVISEGMANKETTVDLLVKLKALQVGTGSGPFTTAQSGLLSRHNTDIVQLYWQDLLTSAAMAQGRTAPTFPDKPMLQVAKAEPFGALPVEVVVDGKPIERPRRIQSLGTLRVSSIRDEYFTQIERDYEKIGTRKKLKRGVDRFISMMNDPALQEIKPKTAYDFVDCQLEANPNASSVSIKDYHWAASSLLSFCVRKGYVDVSVVR